MAMLVPGVVFFFCYFVSGYTFSSNGSTPYEVPIQGSRAIVKEAGLVSPRIAPGFGPLPDFLRVPASEDFKALFAPSLGSSDVPDEVTAILSATPAVVTPDPYAPLVRVVCRVSSFFVRVSRSLFTNRFAVRFLRLGLCRVNRRSLNYFYFFYRPTSSCGFTRTEEDDHVSVTIKLTYNPPGPVVLEQPLDLDVECRYHRIHHVFSAGFQPTLLGGPVPVTLTSDIIAEIVPRDAAGNDLTGPQVFNLGDTIFFEARLTSIQARAISSQRLYVTQCFITATENPTTEPRYAVIDNLGCMVAGRFTRQARFLRGASRSVVSFSVGVVVFKELLTGPGPITIYMHCEIVTGPLNATPTRKSCNRRYFGWRELYDSSHVCSCCRKTDTCGYGYARATNTYQTSNAMVVNTAVEPIDDGEILSDFDSKSDLDY